MLTLIILFAGLFVGLIGAGLVGLAVESYAEKQSRKEKIKAAIWRLKDEIWAYQGDFFPPMNRFRERSFRAHISGLLRRMGSVCDEILKLYEEAL